MLARSLVIAVVAFSMGFLAAYHLQELSYEAKLSALDASDARSTSRAFQQTQETAGAFSGIETQAFKEIQHVDDEIERLRHSFDNGLITLRLRAPGEGTAPVSGAAACACAADGARTELNASARSDYFAVRRALGRCPAKVKALQDILREERRVRSTE